MVVPERHETNGVCSTDNAVSVRGTWCTPGVEEMELRA